MNDFINKQRQKILFLITQSDMGGAQRFLVNLVTRLDRARYEILVAGGPDGGGELFDKLEKLNIKTHKLVHAKRIVNPIKDWLAILEIRKLIKEFGPDILFLNSSKTTVWGPMAVNFPTKLKLSPKIIYRIGGWSFNDPRPTWEKRLWIWLEKTFAKYKDTIIVNNLYDFEQAKSLGIKPKGTVELIYNGIDAGKLDFLPREKAREKLGIKKDDIIIGTIANFYPAKGLAFLIDAIKLLPTNYLPTGQAGSLPTPKRPVAPGALLATHYIIIGDGPERQNLESRIKNLELENKIFLTGKVPDAYKYLQAFDIFVLPSVKEGFPWAVLEAMAAKLPVVAPRVGAIPEMIENGKNGFIVEPRNSEQLAEAIKKLLDNEHLRQEFGIQAHQTVLFKFDEDKMVKQIEKKLL